MVIWYFLSRTRGKRCFLKGGSTKLAARMTVFKTVVFNPFTFSFRVVCFSILSDCFGLWDGLSLSSHHTLHFLTSLLFFFFFLDTTVRFRASKVSRGVQSSERTKKKVSTSWAEEIPQRLSCVAFRRNFSQGKCAMLSNLFLFFFFFLSFPFFPLLP